MFLVEILVYISKPVEFLGYKPVKWFHLVMSYSAPSVAAVCFPVTCQNCEGRQAGSAGEQNWPSLMPALNLGNGSFLQSACTLMYISRGTSAQSAWNQKCLNSWIL